MRLLQKLVIVVAALAAFGGTASAAPTWLPAHDLSAVPASGTPSSSTVASDATGETFAAWLRSDGTNNRVEVSEHTPGAPWTTPVDLSDAGQPAGEPDISLSSTGFGALVWTRSDGTNNQVQVSRRAPGGTFGPAETVSLAGTEADRGQLQSQPGPQVAVDAAGDVVVVWVDPDAVVVHARRFTAATQSWGAIKDLVTASVPADQSAMDPAIAITPGGVATLAWAFDSESSSATQIFNIETATQSATGVWTTTQPLTNTPSAFEAVSPQLAIDPAGNVNMTWFQYSTTTCPPPAFTGCKAFATGLIFEAATVNGLWQTAQILSDPGLISDDPRIVSTPAGDITVAWTEHESNGIKTLTRPSGGTWPPASAATIIAPQNAAIESGLLFSNNFSSLHLAAGPTGTIATFGRLGASNTLAEAVFRPTGGSWPNPALTAPTVLSIDGADVGATDGPNVTFDGLGNAVATWTRDTEIQSAAFDGAPPAITAANVPATAVAGTPVAMSATTLDTWSALSPGQPSWSFGDTNLGAGGSVTHVYGAPGTYTVTVGASDAVGNISAPVAKQIVITSPPVPPLAPTTVAKPKLKAVWKSNKLVGTITLTGTVGVATTLTAAVQLHGAKKVSVTVRFAATGTWSHALKLPSGLVPGRYDVTVSGKGAQTATTSFTLVAPKSGIVKRSYATGPRRGPAVSTLGKSDELWAHFSFGTLPKKGQKITTQWILPNGHKLAANTRPRTALVEAQVKDLSGKNLPAGRWRCIIRVGGTTLVTLNVRLK
ncbi:MAG TPA: PKD domain-containing protein [Gaiellales bacterium]